jgi:sarcosine oxidase delta subunit
LIFTSYQLWRLARKSVDDMTIADIKNLQLQSDEYTDMETKLNSLLFDTDEETAEKQELRETLIKCRNYFRSEREELDDFISISQNAYEKRLISITAT